MRTQLIVVPLHRTKSSSVINLKRKVKQMATLMVLAVVAIMIAQAINLGNKINLGQK